VPSLPQAGGRIDSLRLHLVQDDKDPAHALWNRLIVREHPLGRRPLVGAQLRYLVDQMPSAPKNLHLLVRAQHDRNLEGGGSLRELLAQEAVGGRMEVPVPRREGRPARTAILELRWREVEFKAPVVARKKSWPSLKLYALWAHEVGTPDGQEPMDWTLLTTWPITSLKVARRIVKWYALRWGIECWHKVLKSVCRVESRQLKSLQALERALAFDMIVASRALLLNRLGKDHPELPAELFYSPEELEVLDVKKKTRANS